MCTQYSIYNAGQKTLGHLRKYYAMTKCFKVKNYHSISWHPSSQYKVETLWLGYMHKSQPCIGGGEGSSGKIQFVGRKVKCPKTSDQDYCRQANPTPQHKAAIHSSNTKLTLANSNTKLSSAIFHYHLIYHKLTIDHLSMWLGRSVDRALHRYRKVMGSNPVQA